MRQRPALGICLGWILWILCCHLMRLPLPGEMAEPVSGIESSREETVTEITGTAWEVRMTERSTRCYLKNVRAVYGERQQKLPPLLLQTDGQEEILPGFVVSAIGTIEPLEQAGNPGQFDPASYYAAWGIQNRVWADRVTILAPRRTLSGWLFRIREQIRAFFIDSMHENAAGILTAMLLGDKSVLTEESQRNFQVGGCLHMLVISGLHVSLLGGAMQKLLLRLRLPPTAAAVCAGGLMLGYTALISWPVAAMRACWMFLIRQLAQVTRRSYDAISALAVSALLMLLHRPGMLFHAGFQLSYGASLGAIVVAPLLKKAQTGRFAQYPGKEGVTSWLAIQLTTLPLLAYYFYELPVFALPLNLLLLPFLPFVLGAAILAAITGMFLPVVGRILLFPVDGMLVLADRILAIARSLPGSSWTCGQPSLWQVIGYYALFTLFLVFLSGRLARRRKVDTKRRLPGRRIFQCLLPAFVILFLRLPPAFALTMLDVGQGDCFVIRQRNTVILSDGGSTNVDKVGQYRILPYLQSQGIREVALCLISHDDADHANGLEQILDLIAEKKTALRIRCVGMPVWMIQTDTGERIRRLAEEAGAAIRLLEAGDQIRTDKMTLSILHPFPTGGAQEGNAGSLVFQLEHAGFCALFTGDLEKEGEEELLPYLTDVDCLKVAHHGSKHSTSKEFLAITRPEIALVSAPEKSVYRHPHEETLERLDEPGVTIYMTKELGAVTIDDTAAEKVRQAGG